jgi:hypothetical protein
VTVTLVLRLLRGPLHDDLLVGHAEIVATGASHPIRGLDDLIAVAHAASEITEGPADADTARVQGEAATEATEP